MMPLTSQVKAGNFYVMEKTRGATLTFRLSYIILPVVILLLSVILTAFFYPRLPVEVAYHFQPDGSPDRWLSRSAIVFWTLLPQLLLTLLAGGVTWGIAKLSGQYIKSESTGIRPERIILFMGNMIGLPQIILGFAMLDIFSYNSYQIHLLPLWVFALIVMVAGGIFLAIFSLQSIRQVWRVNKEE
jgi:uncharacterized membrane protein